MARVVESIEQYDMEGADEFLLPERIAEGFVYPGPPALERGEREIASAKVKINGEWREL